MHVCCLTRITLGHEIKGGMEVHIDMLARALADRGHRVSIVTTSHPLGVERQSEGGVTVHYLPGCRPGKYSHEWGNATPEFLARLHQEEPIDLIWGEGAGAFYYLKWFRNPLRLPVVSFLQGSYLGEMGTFLSLARFEGMWGQFLRFAPRRTVQYFRWDLWYTHGADAVIGASRENAALARWGYLLPARKVSASVNGIDPQHFKPDAAARTALRADLGLAETTTLLLHCSRLEPEKGAQYSIRAFAQLAARFPDSRLLVAGNGTRRQALETLAEGLDLGERVMFVDHVPNQELPAFYNACDVFLCPTIAVESFGITVAEAMACGRPVVAFRRGGIQTSIDHGVNGLLVKAGSVGGLAAATTGLLADPEMHRRIGEAARRKAVESLSVERMTEDVLKVFTALVAEDRR
jgi:glycosyltransferase involved in cell wall biosynthesis